LLARDVSTADEWILESNPVAHWGPAGKVVGKKPDFGIREEMH